MSCFRKTNGTINRSKTDFPLGDFEDEAFRPCCGEGDSYLTRGVCLSAKGHREPGATGYYLVSCTDESFKDAVCVQQCSRFSQQSIIYDTDRKLWHCCGGPADGPSCASPSDETFNGPAPKELGQLPPEPRVTINKLPSTTVPPSGSLPTISPTATSTAGSGRRAVLSAGAIAGIVVGAVAFLVIVAVAVWIILRRRKQKFENELATTPFKARCVDEPSVFNADIWATDNASPPQPDVKKDPDSPTKQELLRSSGEQVLVEADGEDQRVEADGDTQMVELDALSPAVEQAGSPRQL